MTSTLTVHADTVLNDIDHLPRCGTAERAALATLLIGRMWGALTERERGFADADARCAQAGLPAPALVLTGVTEPGSYAAAADMLGAEAGACAVFTPRPAAADAALAAGMICLALDSGDHAPTRPGGVIPLGSLADLVPNPASPWASAFAA
ncbi:hypothetical protein [Streptomyces mesophilus]|uniref:hypothetical protein n=1 Tax=Streptomyces mesophilus TaxID=1775132 RepID=UPI00331AA527